MINRRCQSVFRAITPDGLVYMLAHHMNRGAASAHLGKLRRRYGEHDAVWRILDLADAEPDPIDEVGRLRARVAAMAAENVQLRAKLNLPVDTPIGALL